MMKKSFVCMENKVDAQNARYLIAHINGSTRKSHRSLNKRSRHNTVATNPDYITHNQISRSSKYITTEISEIKCMKDEVSDDAVESVEEIEINMDERNESERCKLAQVVKNKISPIEKRKKREIKKPLRCYRKSCNDSLNLQRKLGI